jgi:lipopolysaccharide export system permease protein
MSGSHRLRWGGRLDRYVIGHFIGSYGTALFLVVGLYLVLDMASNVGDYITPASAEGDSPVLRYYLIQVPFLFLQVAPFVTLLAGMFTVNRLLKKNEVTAILAAGVSSRRLTGPILLVGLVLSVGMFVLRETLIEVLADERDRLHWSLVEGEENRAYEDIVVHGELGSLVFLERYFPEGTGAGVPVAEGVVAILSEDERYTRIDASGATWTGESWSLAGAERQEMGASAASEPVAFLEEVEDLDLDPELVLTYRRAGYEPLELSFAEVGRLMQREPDDMTYRTLWHYHLTFPLANVILLLVGLPLLFQYERGRGSERLALGGLLCVFFFAADFVFRNLGLSGGLSPLLASWTPVLGFGSLGIVLFEGMRS